VLYEARTVNKSTSYPLGGADAFQLFFDRLARKRAGVGNVIRAAIVVDGEIPEQAFRSAVNSNRALLELSSLCLKRKWYSPFRALGRSKRAPIPENIFSFHAGDPVAAISSALARDCSFANGSPVFVDVIPLVHQTCVIISANHVLMDYAGMENLIASFSGAAPPFYLPQKDGPGKSFFKKLKGAIEATLFVASVSGWNMKRLSLNTGKGKAALEKLELSADETQHVKFRAADEMQSGALPFYLGCSLFSLCSLKKLLAGSGRYFIAVPVERRPAAGRNAILSNYISFLYFHAGARELKSIKDVSLAFTQQMVSQARKNLPEKFSSLLDLFRFVPDPLYRAFINLPSNGHSGTFAFSLLSGSRLENNSFMGFPVADVTHYAPVVSPPGLNIVFTEFKGRLKIILSFDESRITRESAHELLAGIRKNLLG
jgi:hypothetical protein